MTEEKENKGPEIVLKVAKAMPEDSEKGIIRMDSKSMQTIGVAPGDIVEVEDKRTSVAVAAKAYPSDVGLGVVRMDGFMRRNSGTGIGEHVKVRKADVKEAQKVTLAPAQKGIQIQMLGTGFEKSLLGRPVMKGDIISPLRVRQQRRQDPFGDIFSQMFGEGFSPLFGFPGLKLMVVSTKPAGPVIITDMTEVEMSPEAVEVKELERVPQVTYEDIGGLSKEIAKVREMIELPLKYPELFDRLGIQPPSGVLLFGPPGTGKTLLAKAVANETGANFLLLSGPECMSKWYGESEKRIRDLFEEAEKNAPSIIFIDEIDAIAPKREEVSGEVERRVVSQILAMMDGMKARGKVIVIAATNRADSLDPALRRGGRFDREIEIGVPDRQGRKEVLQIHTRAMPLTEDVKLDKWADITYGYVGADLEAICKEAAMSALRRALPNINLDEAGPIPPEVMESLRVTQKDFQNGMKNVSPSAMREVLVEIPKVTWNDVGGLENVKQDLREAVEWPLKNPQSFKRMGIRPPRGVLLYGPPGTGKTLLAKAVANESKANFISVRGPQLLSKWVGESLPYDEEVLILKDGIMQRVRIGDLVDDNAEEDGKISAPTVTDNFCSKNSKVVGFIRHNAPSHVDVITTETGRRVRVTGGHSLFVRDNDEIMEIRADEIKPDQTRIAVPLKIKAPETLSEINFLDALVEDDHGLFVCNGQKQVQQAFNKIGIKKAAKIIGIETKNAYVYGKNAALRASKFMKLLKAAGIVPNYEKLKITSWIRTHKFPAIIKIDKDFTTFLGVWVAEGSYGNNFVRLSLSLEESGKIEKLCKKLFGKVTLYSKPNTKGRDVLICSTALQVLMKQVLGMDSGSESKRVPTAIFSAPLSSIAGFLRGYMSGDGHFSGKYVEASTISKELANDIMTLFQYFGILLRCKKKKEWNGSTSYRVRFLWSGFLREFANKIGFLDERKTIKIKNYVNNLKLKRVLQSPEQNIDGDIYWDRVIEKVREPYDYPFVYDISINPTERFIAGFGGVLVHNSERGLRKVFKKARQVSPAIIFFDELDAIAPVRGRDTGSHVTETVVNQFLTELDGLEDLEGVVVLGATNRPDIIDPGLLRPGRFDRHVLTPVPDKGAREKIFTVHTKNMPLAKDVSIKKLAELTDNYVGADIEALCREAAMLSLREDLKSKDVKMKHFKKAMDQILPSMTKELEDAYEKVLKGFKKSKATAKTEAEERERAKYIG